MALGGWHFSRFYILPETFAKMEKGEWNCDSDFDFDVLFDICLWNLKWICRNVWHAMIREQYLIISQLMEYYAQGINE